jgi:hypothetical protein
VLSVFGKVLTVFGKVLSIFRRESPSSTDKSGRRARAGTPRARTPPSQNGEGWVTVRAVHTPARGMRETLLYKGVPRDGVKVKVFF